jgi:hypothetical protein
MDPTLSRRAAMIMHTQAVESMDFDARDAFVNTVSRAPNFDALPDDAKKIILDGEKERAAQGWKRDHMGRMAPVPKTEQEEK